MGKTPAPKGVIKDTIQIRLPVESIEKIDSLINDGKYSSRSDFINQLVIKELSNSNELLLERMDDPEVKKKIQQICKETFAQVFTDKH
ncbi:ribbon-helix-helix domain-containing protein [Methanospirillum stamsii]|uniref:Ribbon-helix-helix protein CopG domain-containing protein n=1 Tax=Methanospirillum stamsii TaxID=1277351 RepID=A0A2V2N8F9_9EURY|nr:ribbon-helix-helix protein, CopG family [Methanospirillum stamsii]PWR74845.1 hypothetical protein DLD82_08075 [Methanospirillum stamsii]